jgi:hypothetical protein
MAPVRKASIISNHTPLRPVSSSADLNAAIAWITPAGFLQIFWRGQMLSGRR